MWFSSTENLSNCVRFNSLFYDFIIWGTQRTALRKANNAPSPQRMHPNSEYMGEVMGQVELEGPGF